MAAPETERAMERLFIQMGLRMLSIPVYRKPVVASERHRSDMRATFGVAVLYCSFGGKTAKKDQPHIAPERGSSE